MVQGIILHQHLRVGRVVCPASSWTSLNKESVEKLSVNFKKTA